MGKKAIAGSEFSDTDLEYGVCSHLQPILDVLEKHGNTYDHFAPLYRDKYSESKKAVNKAIDFDLIERTFEIPRYMTLGRTDRIVLCQTCWCSIVEKV